MRQISPGPISRGDARADLTNALLQDTALSATRFVDDTGAALLSGARFEGSYGLVEEQEEFVRNRI